MFSYACRYRKQVIKLKVKATSLTLNQSSQSPRDGNKVKGQTAQADQLEMMRILENQARTQTATTELLQQLAANQGAIQRNSVKLPTLQLPKFNGKVLKFQEFHDMFIATVDSKTNLSNVKKFTYLKGSLSGVALEVVSG